MVLIGYYINMKKHIWWIAICVVLAIIAGIFYFKPSNIGAYFPAIQLMDALTSQPKSVTFNAEGLRVLSQDYLYGLAEGDISGHSPFAKYGRVSAVNASEVDVIPWSATYIFPTTSQALVATSSSANDIAAGSGIQSIVIEGLDASYATTSETLTLAGTSNATTSKAFYRVNRIYAATVGTGGIAAGQIYLRSVTTSNRVGSIETGYTQSRQMIYTVPRNQSLYVTSIRGSCGVGYLAGENTMKQTYNTFTTRANYNGTVTTTFFLPYNEFGTTGQMSIVPLEMPTKLIGTTDLKISVIGDVANSVTCQAALRGWLE